jgi:Single Cache domain 2
MLKRLHLSTRIALVAILPTVCFACALLWIHPTIRASHYESKYARLKQLDTAAWSAIDYDGAQVRKGAMTTGEAQEAAKRTVRSMRFGSGEGDYFWINDLHPRMVMNSRSWKARTSPAKRIPMGYIFSRKW